VGQRPFVSGLYAIDIPEASSCPEDRTETPDPAQTVQAILADAEAQAADILAKARKEAEALRREAVRAGYLEGAERGKAEGRAEYLKGLQAVAKLDQALRAEREHQLQAMKAEMWELVLLISEKVLRTAISQQDAAYLGLFQGALEKARSKEALKIRVHPDHYDLLCRFKARPPQGFDVVRDMEILCDAHLDPRDCVLDTPWGRIDAGLSAQISQIRLAAAQLLPAEQRGG
jgi:flagellar assembly protein FliH